MRACGALATVDCVPPSPDPIFADNRLARIYDEVDSDRSDLDHYETIVREFDAASVLDVGCGTGSLACRLAASGTEVIGLDPARASLDVARSKPGANLVTWILGDVTKLPAVQVDLAVMTGNVAQVFLTDEDWLATLRSIRRSLDPNGRIVFETRDPAVRAWESWDSGTSSTIVSTIDGDIETWTTVLDVSEPLVTFRHHYRFVEPDDVITSDSTLRFRSLGEIQSSMSDASFVIDEIRDAPDRPGKEFVVIAHPTSGTVCPTTGV